MNQFTFWNTNDTQEHLTLAFGEDGHVWHLTRDDVKSVSPVWQLVGRTWNRSGKRVIRFDVIVPHLAIAATQLNRNGAQVRGVSVMLETQVTSMRTDKVTDPDTLLGRTKRKSLDLGLISVAEKGAAKYGKRFECDPAAMHAAIMARK